MLTCSCSIAAREIGATPHVSPGELRRPNELLNADPSTVMLFRRLSVPENDSVPPDCGVRRVMSFSRPDTVGSFANWSRETVVDAPVRAELKTGSVWPDTVISSFTIGCTVNDRSVALPRLTVMLSCVCAWNTFPPGFGPTTTEYGPPTRMFGMMNRPSSRVTVSYGVPDGR